MSKTVIAGLLLVNKPPQLTSHDVVALIRKWLGLKTVGHAGTLDPMATGLLIILVGKATRLAEYLKAETKTYTGSITLGVATDTFDAEGQIIKTKPCQVSEAEVKKAAQSFIPGYEQTPPPYAAVKIKGKPAYRLARAGKEVKLKPRAVKIYSLQTELSDSKTIKFSVSCSAGTYVRSLAVDLAARLNCVGHLSSLTRMAVGRFSLKQALTLEELKEAVANSSWQQHLIPLLEAVSWPLIYITENSLAKVENGQTVSEEDFFVSGEKPAILKQDQLVRLADQANNLVAVGKVVSEKPLKIHPKKVLA